MQAPTTATNSGLQLGLGELEAIALAEELRADALLIDDWDGRQRRFVDI